MSKKLSDSKWLQPKKATVAPAPQVDSLDLNALRDGFRMMGGAKFLLPEEDGQFEPVTFQHPETGHKIYGLLVAVEASGDLRVEAGNNEYAVVPRSEVRKIGHKEDKAAIQAKLAAAIKPLRQAGVRADFVATGIAQVAGSENQSLVTLKYSQALGIPNDSEVVGYMRAFHPTASVLDADVSVTGSVSILAEMGAFEGGEVLETFDPEKASKQYDEGDENLAKLEVPEAKDTKLKAIEPDAVPAEGLEASKTAQYTPLPSTKTHDYHAMSSSIVKDPGLTDQILQAYFKAGGGKTLASVSGNFNTAGLVAAGLPIVQRVNPSLWQKVVQLSGVHAVDAPGTPAAPGEDKTSPANSTKPTEDKTNPANATPGAQPNPGATKRLKFEDESKPFNTPLNEDKPLQFTDASKKASKAATAKSLRAPGAKPITLNDWMDHLKSMPPAGDWLTKHGLPPNEAALFASMELDNMHQAGSYIVADVSWDKSMTKDLNVPTMKARIATFVNTTCGLSLLGNNHGFIGNIYMKDVEPVKGTASIRFCGEYPGQATLTTTQGKK